MADVHTEDMVSSLNIALSSMREALDTTVKIEQDFSMSPNDRTINVNIIKVAIAKVLSTLQNCDSDRYEGIPAPNPYLSGLRINNIGGVVDVGTENSIGASADFTDHNGKIIAVDREVTVTWLSSDSGIVSINSSTGVYTTLVPGNVTITARHQAGAVTSVAMVVI